MFLKQTPDSFAVFILSLLVGVFLFGCASTWKKDRETIIDPIHGMLHHDYPEALEEGDRARIASLFASSDSDEASAAAVELL